MNNHHNFNSHAHVERDIFEGDVVRYDYDFNSHAHVERDGFVAGVARSAEISTHTLTWSVTWQSPNNMPSGCYFNSHAHVERDRFNVLPINFRHISTHTLTWSVTFYPACGKISQCISTHTLTWSVTQHISVTFCF